MYLSKESTVYIYGAGVRGVRLYKSLKKYGFNNLFFIDKYINKTDIPDSIVFTLEQLYYEDIPQKSVAICTVANVFKHEEIVKNISDIGIEYIIFKDLIYNSRINDIFDYIYIHMMELDYDSSNVDISTIESFNIESITKRNHSQKNTKYVEDIFGNIRVKMPILLIHEHEKPHINKNTEKNETYNRRWGKNVCYYLTYKGLFHFCNSGDDSKLESSLSDISECYYAENPVSEHDDRASNLLRHIFDRISIFNMMDYMYSFNKQFFEDNPPVIKYDNIKKKWSIIDGSNRIAFLGEKGLNYITCKIEKSDYHNWMRDISSFVYNCDDKYDSFVFSSNVEKYNTSRIMLWKKILEYLNRYRILDKKPFVGVCYPSLALVYLLDKMDANISLWEWVFEDSIFFETFSKSLNIKDTKLFNCSKLDYIDLIIAKEEIIKTKPIILNDDFTGCLIIDGNKNTILNTINSLGLPRPTRQEHLISYYEDNVFRKVDALFYKGG